jgi:hypothetical protein
MSHQEELGIDCQVGHPAKIRAAEPRKQKHDRPRCRARVAVTGGKSFSFDLDAFPRTTGRALTEAVGHAVRKDAELQRFYQHKLVQKGLGKAKVAAARKLGIRLWILLRDQIDYQEFCRHGQLRQKHGGAHAGMPA